MQILARLSSSDKGCVLGCDAVSSFASQERTSVFVFSRHNDSPTLRRTPRGRLFKVVAISGLDVIPEPACKKAISSVWKK
jgi:hypothetical protein